MKAGILGDVRLVLRDLIVGLALFAGIAMLVLGGEMPSDLTGMGHVLSAPVNAAEMAAATPLADTSEKTFRFGGSSALVAMAVMFATLYAFNLALFRRFRRVSRLARRRNFSIH